MDANNLFSREQSAGYDPDTLKRSVVLVVGAGALGQNVFLDLILSGVGGIRLVDKDEFEHHNRTRSPLFPRNPKQEGIRKAEVVARQAIQLSPKRSTRISFAHAWIEELGGGSFLGADVIVSCVDDHGARGYLCDQAQLHGIPLVEGGFNGLDVTMSCYRNDRTMVGETGCWRCSNPHTEGAVSCKAYAREAEEIGIVPATQNGAACLASIMSEAVIQFLHGMYEVAESSLDFSVRTGVARRIRHSRDPLCQAPHRSLKRLRRLPVSPIDTVRSLFAALDPQNNGGQLRLDSPFCLDVPCPECTQMSRPARPARAWQKDGTCENCGGSVVLSPKGASFPRIYPLISSESPDEILDLPCSAIGLNYGSVVEFDNDQHRTVLRRLLGGPEELFQSVTRKTS